MIESILTQLHKVQNKGEGKYMACCPAHDDKNPSLALSSLPDGRILMKCFAGCDVSEVLESLGLSITDLFPEGSLKHYKGFQQLERQIQRKDHLSHDRTILAIAQADRESGKRLSPADLKREQQAYLKVRQCKQ